MLAFSGAPLVECPLQGVVGPLVAANEKALLPRVGSAHLLAESFGRLLHEFPYEVRVIREIPGFDVGFLSSPRAVRPKFAHHLASFEPGCIVEKYDRHVNRSEDSLDLLLARMPEPDAFGNELGFVIHVEIAS